MSRPNTLFNKLFSRQKGNCYICGCGMSRVTGKPNSATLDHIIPKSAMRKMGIELIPNNKKLACKRCNEKKGDSWFLEKDKK